MNKVLMSGLAVGKDVGVCASCNFDYSWVLAYPAMLVWSDGIILTPTIWAQLTSGAWPPNVPELARCLKIIFELAHDAHIVEVRDPSQVVTPDLATEIWKQAEADHGIISHAFPGRVSLDDRGLVVDGHDYCLPYVASLYSVLVLSAAWNAHCFLSDRALTYWKYRFGTASPQREASPHAEGFQSVFDAYLPNEPLGTKYLECSLVHRDKLGVCEKRPECERNSLAEIEKNAATLLHWRDYDEVHQLRDVVERIVRQRESAGGALNPEEVTKDVRELERKLNRRMRLVFPKITRWADIVTMLSVPVTLASVETGSRALICSAASLGAIAQLGKIATSVLKSHYSWIGFNPKELKLD
ncbi:MAG: hypothetical protein ACLQNE_31930 [Thermoguttaceae bacterium]